jgi:hypothetical protein
LGFGGKEKKKMIPDWLIMVSVTLSIFNFIMMWVYMKELDELKENKK